ncbi:MAG: hypothetical protein JWO83_3499 [Caulobacteraceae bacterium]|nr:hypothetical protein [Caulobacteraceae bacterium]
MTEKTRRSPPLWLIKALVNAHVAVYRLSGGALGGKMGKGPVALLTVRGRSPESLLRHR